MSGEITLSITTHRPAYEVMQTPQQAYLLIEATPVVGPSAAVNQAVNFSLVLDRSGSMAGDKLNNLKMAASALVDRLGPKDTLTIVIFDETADVVVPGQPVNDRELIKRQIQAIQERGGTRMSTGIKAGLSSLQQWARPDRVNRLLLLTDGQTWEDMNECLSLAGQSRQAGMPWSVMGLGVGGEGQWDPRFLESLAGQSGGEWYAIDSVDKVAEVFANTLTAMQGTAVTNAQFTMRLAADVKPRNVWRVAPMISRLDHRSVSERDVQIFLGDIQYGAGQSVLVEALLPARVPGSYRLVQADITYDVPGANLTSQRVTQEVIIQYTPDGALAAQVNGKIMNIVERVNAFKLQTQALDEAASGQVQNATRRLRAAATVLLDLGEQEMAQNAIQQAQQMEQGGQMDPGAAQAMRYKTKLLTESITQEQAPPALPDAPAPSANDPVQGP